MENKKHIFSSPAFSERVIAIYDIPIPDAVNILHCDQAVLRFGTYSVDVGSLCYLRRTNGKRSNKNGSYNPRLVDLSSFSEAREKQIKSLISYASDLVTNGGYRVTTVHDYISILSRFMDWADTSGHHDALAGNKSTYDAFRAYVAFLREKVKRHEIVLRTGASQQFKVLKFVSGWLGLHDLHRGVNQLTLAHAQENPTEPPAENDLGKVEALCEALFKGLSDLVLDSKPFPCRLSMPGYLEFPEDALWVFPTRVWCAPQHVSKEMNQYKAYDFANGTVRSLDEIATLYKFNERWRAVKAISNAQSQIIKANENPRDFWRVMAALRAHNAFIMMFLGQTGMNLAVALSLNWSDEYTVGTAQQGFRAIKWRAGGKLYSTVIRMKFIPLFTRFIALRKYILNGRACERLFVSLGIQNQGDPAEMSTQSFYAFYRTLHHIDPTLPKILSRKFRAAKDDYHIRHNDVALTSKIMGRTEATTRKAYASGTKTAHYNEISTFLDQVSQSAINKAIILDSNQASVGCEEMHVGSCANSNAPSPISDQVPIIPDCITQEGCLFCDKYRVHSDEKDTRKLVSCAFVVKQAMQMPGTEGYFVPVLDRIASILEEIKSRNSENVEMVKMVAISVEEDGELDPYWAAKLALIDSLEYVV